MNNIPNSGPNNLDDYLKIMLDNYQPDVSKSLWKTLKIKLFKKNIWDFVSFKKLQRTFSYQSKIGAAHIKVLVSYAVAACFTVALVFGTNYVYKNFVTNTHEKNVVKEKTTAVPVKPQAKITSDTQKTNPAPQHVIQNATTVKHHEPQDKTTPVTAADNNPIQPVATVPVNTTTTTQPIQTDANANSNRSTLLNYIDRVNSKDKTSLEETNVEEYPDNININIEQPEAATPEDAESFAYNLEIPNVFTPNGDGFNDFFVIKNLEKYPYNSLTIADRNGKVVYDVINYQNNWDARNLAIGTYYYILNYKSNNKNQGMIKGIISVVR